MTTLCECGCGQPTPLAKHTDPKRNQVKGQPLRFIRWHHLNHLRHLAHWKGGRRKTHNGYVLIRNPDHPHAVNGYVREHILIAERALGKELPALACVHHINEDRTDNRNTNLVICENTHYHSLLHVRMRALKACGNPSYERCVHCKKYDDPLKMYEHPNRRQFHHRACNAAYQRAKKGIF